MLEVIMPILPSKVKRVKLIQWHKAEGDEVLPGDLLAVIETNKVAIEIEAENHGTLVKILVLEGTEGIATGTTLALLNSALDVPDAMDTATSVAEVASGAAAALSLARNQDGASSSSPFVGGDAFRSSADEEVSVFATPLARRIAKQRGVDLSLITGSGPYGRIVEEDVEQAQSC